MARWISVHIFYIFGFRVPQFKYTHVFFFCTTPIVLLLVKLDKYGLQLVHPSEVSNKGTHWDFPRSQPQGFTCRTMHCWGSRLPTFRYKSDFIYAPPQWLGCSLHNFHMDFLLLILRLVLINSIIYTLLYYG